MGLWGVYAGAQAMDVYQKLVDVAGNNVANAATPGYSAQRANLVSAPPVTIAGDAYPGPGMVSSGAEVVSVTRLRSFALDVQYRQATATGGFWDAQAQGLQHVEALLGGPATAPFQQALDGYFTAWNAVAQDAQNLGVRAAALGKAQTLVIAANDLSMQVQQLVGDLQGQAQADVTQANQLLSQIAGLENAIARQQAMGQQPNDLMDRRDLLLDQLAQLMPIGVQITPSSGAGTGEGFTVTAKDATGNEISLLGRTAGSGTVTVQQTLQLDPTGGTLQAVPGDGGDPVVLASGGEIAGLLAAAQKAGSFLQGLDALMQQVASQANALLASGYDLYGAQGSTQTFLFVLADATGQPIQVSGAYQPPEAGAPLAVNPTLIDDPARLAVAQAPPDAGRPSSDGQIAGRIAGGQPAADGQWAQVVNALATDSQSAQQQATISDSVVQTLQQQRQQFSGVDLNQEVAALIASQSAYQAAARVVSVNYQMLQDLLQHV